MEATRRRLAHGNLKVADGNVEPLVGMLQERYGTYQKSDRMTRAILP